MVADLIRLNADLIVASAPAATRDPIAFGFVASLARPGGNVTGFSLLARADRVIE
jgi:putative ABC transport system substrate-binding protein